MASADMLLTDDQTIWSSLIDQYLPVTYKYDKYITQKNNISLTALSLAGVYCAGHSHADSKNSYGPFGR